MESICVVCQVKSPKYKCSNCYVPYCSSGCWKLHKDEEDCKKQENVNMTPKIQMKKSLITDDTLPLEQLEKLSSNSDLKELLRDPLLQKLLIGVDCSVDPNEAVQKAMQDSSFVQFVDSCLGMVEEPEEKDGVNS